MNHLLRELAPITGRAWAELEEEAKRQLTAALAARRLVDFSGPHGWQHGATDLGRTEPAPDPGEGVTAVRRRVLPLTELRADFALDRGELADAERGAEDADLDPLAQAARRMAVAENRAVFDAIIAATPNAPIALGDDLRACPRQVAGAVEVLLGRGVAGPYGLALGNGIYRGVIETTEHGGYPVFEHLRHITEGPLVYAPGVDGAVVVSLRGGDFLLEVGQDLAIGYEGHDAEAVRLYLVESFSFRVAAPEAAVSLPAG